MKPLTSKLLFRHFAQKALFCWFIAVLLSINSNAQIGNAPKNQPTPWTSDQFAVSGSDNLSGLCLLSSISGSENLTSATQITNVNIGVGLGCTANLSVVDNNNEYPAGTWAGFRIGANNLLSLSVFPNITIKTFNNGSATGDQLVVSASLLGLSLLADGTSTPGFITTQPFDEIKISYASAVAVSYNTEVYHATIVSYADTLDLNSSDAYCNTAIGLTQPDFPVHISNSGMTGITLGTMDNLENIIDSNNTNFASITLPVGIVSSAYVAVKKELSSFPSGYFAGFSIAKSSILSLDILSNITITTYLNGNQQEAQSGSNLVLSTPILSSEHSTVGFVTTLPFDELRFTVNQIIGVNLGTIQLYEPTITRYCQGPDMTNSIYCNTSTPLTTPEFPVYISAENTGIDGVACIGCSVNNPDNSIDSDPSNYTEMVVTANVGSYTKLAIKDALTQYGPGMFVGFDIENSSLADIDLLTNSISIVTIQNGITQETISANQLLSVGSGLLNGSNRRTLGFVTSQPFNEVVLIITNLVGIDLGTTRVYNLSITPFCPGPELVCNTPTNMTTPTYPVFINGERTGIEGVICIGCSVSNSNNLINSDATDYATIEFTAAVLASGSISVKNALTEYVSGTYAGFDIENTALLDVDAINSIRINTYLNGVLQESKTGNSELISVDTSLLTTEGRRSIGFVTSMNFDEVQLILQNTVELNLGSTKIYSNIIQNLCATPIECDQTYYLNSPQFPVIINSSATGIDGLACVGCSLQNTAGVLTPENNDYATITMAVGVASSGTVAVHDGINTFPAGSIAGFVVQDMNGLLEIELLSTLSISTYNNGSLVESRSGAQLLNADLLVLFINPDTGVYNIGFRTTQGYDEVRISVGALADVLNIVRVYGAFVDTHGASDPGLGFNCPYEIIATDDTAKILIGDSYTLNVLSNDTLNNETVTTETVTISLVTPEPNGYLTLDPTTGIVSVSPSTPLGTYTLEYQICETAYPTNCDTAIVTITVSDALFTVTKVADKPTYDTVGEIITYTITVTNSGNVTLTNIVVTDDLTGDSWNVASLAPNAAQTFTTTYTITQADLDAGAVTNSVAVIGKDPNNTDVTGGDQETITNSDAQGAFTVTKVADKPTYDTVGEIITYTITVTNSGNLTLSNIVVTDDLTGDSWNVASLAPNAAQTFTATYTITQVDLDAGAVTNSVAVIGKDPNDNDVTGGDQETITNSNAQGAFTVTKVADKPTYDTVGEIITYTITVTNSGNVTLTNIVVTDDLTGDSWNVASLDTNAAQTFTATYTITQADIDAGSVTNSVAVIGKDPNDNDVTGGDQETITNSDAQGAFTVTKVADKPTYDTVGEIITYTITVTNSGNVTLSNIVVTDDLTGDSWNVASLAPNASQTFTATYTITSQDMLLNQVRNVVRVIGNSPDDTDVEEEGEETVTNNGDISVKVYNAISPNNDGKNDFLYIKGIEYYPNNTLEVYNRWGRKVFEANGYNNSTVIFNGISQDNMTIQKQEGLPSATYYYALRYKNLDGKYVTLTGWLYLNND